MHRGGGMIVAKRWWVVGARWDGWSKVWWVVGWLEQGVVGGGVVGA